MAINVGKDVIMHLEEMLSDASFTDEVVSPTAQDQVDDILYKTDNSMDPYYRAYEPLSPAYAQWKGKAVGNARANLKSGLISYTSTPRESALDGLEYKSSGKSAEFGFYGDFDGSGAFAAGAYTEEADPFSRMMDHQEGITVPQRQWFPHDKDQASGEMYDVMPDVEKRVLDYMNSAPKKILIG